MFSLLYASFFVNAGSAGEYDGSACEDRRLGRSAGPSSVSRLFTCYFAKVSLLFCLSALEPNKS
jgi:hypothetical protein